MSASLTLGPEFTSPKLIGQATVIQFRLDGERDPLKELAGTQTTALHASRPH